MRLAVTAESYRRMAEWHFDHEMGEQDRSVYFYLFAEQYHIDCAEDPTIHTYPAHVKGGAYNFLREWGILA